MPAMCLNGIMISIWEVDLLQYEIKHVNIYSFEAQYSVVKSEAMSFVHRGYVIFKTKDSESDVLPSYLSGDLLIPVDAHLFLLNAENMDSLGESRYLVAIVIIEINLIDNRTA